METTNTYDVAEANLNNVRNKLDKLIRKAAKLGVAPLRYEVGAFEDRVVASRTDEEVASGTFVNPAGEVVKYVRFYKVALIGETPKLAGWEFVATLQHAEDAGNILRSVPGVQLPVEFRTAAPQCAHCKVQRRRNDTFVVRHEDGRYLQVGRNCVADFLGGVDPRDVLTAAKYLSEAGEICEFGGGFGGGPVRVGLMELLTQTAACIRIDGFLSKTKARENAEFGTGRVVSTADDVWSILMPPKPHQRPQDYTQWKADRAPTEADQKTAAEALEWVQAFDPASETLSDYLYNLTVVCGGNVDARGAGLACSAVSAYLREVGRKAELAARAKALAGSQFVGDAGKRLDLDNVVVVKVVSRDSQWGTTHIHTLLTQDGNALTWFGTAAPLQIGATLGRITATVKKHEVYNGTNITVVSRVTVWTEEGIAQANEKAAKKAAREAKRAAKAAKAPKIEGFDDNDKRGGGDCSHDGQEGAKDCGTCHEKL